MMRIIDTLQARARTDAGESNCEAGPGTGGN